MAGCFGAVLALAFGLLMGGANAGEELMTMRVSVPGGRAEVVLATDTARTPPKGRDAAGPEYIGWKNACLRTPLMVAGRSFELTPEDGYGAARPYARALEEKSGFWEYLFRELTPG